LDFNRTFFYYACPAGIGLGTGWIVSLGLGWFQAR
jgi:hypothetical protein